jgi:serine-type D-Ala-D-Ala carboxypeptidase
MVRPFPAKPVRNADCGPMKISLQAVDRLMSNAVAEKKFPGAVLLVSEEGKILLHRAYGLADLFDRRPMTCDTVFDLASLTKPLATTMAVMLLARQEILALDEPCSSYWPACRIPGIEKITVRHLLSHRSGLPAWRPYHLRFGALDPIARREVLQCAVLSENLSDAPGMRTEYSDLGFLVLQWVVEYATGRSLDVFLKTEIFEPLGIESLFFVPHAQRRPQGRFAATELCPLRGKLLLGEVHDDNAHWIGGVAGHAGLFGTAGAVFRVLQELLSADTGRQSHALFAGKWVQRFFEKQNGSSWALGFDTPSPGVSSAGHLFSDGSVGHLGYTGTSFWMDRKRGIVVVLLTNRVHPSRYNNCIKNFRPQLHDAVMNAVIARDQASAGH